jgi:hypothetical protein
MKYSRRAFFKRSGALVLPLSLPPALAAGSKNTSPAEGWTSSRFDVRRCGAKGDGQINDTRPIQSAIDRAGKLGGTVFFPAGRYRSGTLRLKSHTAIYLEAGATLLASPDDSDFGPYEELGYPTFADRETSDFNFGLLTGRDLEHLAIMGPGGIDGNRTKRGGPKPIALKNCRSIRIRDLTICNSPNYNISLLGCDDVDILGVTIQNGYGDGIDPDCCRQVRIANCSIESWDDAIVPKASFALGYRRSTENVTVTNCVLSTACNALKLGTESSGDFKNIAFSNCTIYGQPGRWKRNPTSGVALEMVDGGSLERVVVSNLSMANVRVPIFVRLGNRARSQEVPEPHDLEQILISDLLATGASLTSSITGIPGHPVRRMSLKNIRVTACGGGQADLVTRSTPELDNQYPDGDMFGELPAYGLFCRHVENLVLDNVRLELEKADVRSAVVLEDAEGVDLRMLTAAPPQGDEPILSLRSVHDCFVQGSRALPGTATFLKLSAATSSRVHAVGNDLSAAKQPFLVADDVPAGVLRQEGNLLPKR